MPVFSIVTVYSIENSLRFPVGAAELDIILLIERDGNGIGSQASAVSSGTPFPTAAQFNKPVSVSPLSIVQSALVLVTVLGSTVNTTVTVQSSVAPAAIISSAPSP